MNAKRRAPVMNKISKFSIKTESGPALASPQSQLCLVPYLGGRVSALSVSLTDGTEQTLPSKSTRLPCFSVTSALTRWAPRSKRLLYHWGPGSYTLPTVPSHVVLSKLLTWLQQTPLSKYSPCHILLVRHWSCSRGGDHTRARITEGHPKASLL